VYETGNNQWHPMMAWPTQLAIAPEKIFLAPGGALSNTAPSAASPGFDEYVADPAKPVPFLPRPVHLEGDGESDWQTWLTTDQRPASSRTDVLTYTSPVLDHKVRIAGEPIANIVASTTGTDGDFVVKLIDVYPGRYYKGFDKPQPIPAGERETFRFNLPNASHAFLPGHRIMVQIQSSWFPLYDRNPQTYVDNIFFAPPDAYKKATIHVFDTGADASFVELPVVKTP
jgi:putative CocE/NonD family hydrolase